MISAETFFALYIMLRRTVHCYARLWHNMLRYFSSLPLFTAIIRYCTPLIYTSLPCPFPLFYPLSPSNTLFQTHTNTSMHIHSNIPRHMTHTLTHTHPPFSSTTFRSNRIMPLHSPTWPLPTKTVDSSPKPSSATRYDALLLDF